LSFMQKQSKKLKKEYDIFKINPGSIPDVLSASQRLYDPLGALNMYANAFYYAAEIYFKEITKGLDRKGRYTEERIFPALFLFRHSVELYLKAMILQSLKVQDLNIVFSSPLIGKLFEIHKLDIIYKKLKEVLPPAKIIRLFQAENQYKAELLNELKEGKQQQRGMLKREF